MIQCYDLLYHFFFKATYLPEVAPEQGWDCHEAVVSLIRKSGYQGKISEQLLRSVKTTRYQSSKNRLTYREYIDFLQFDPLASSAVADVISKPRHRDWRTFFRL